MLQLPLISPHTVIEDEYEIGRVLGRGGAAIVYEAVRLEDGKTVAVKVLAPDQGDPQQIRKRFFNELLLIRKTRHPNIVQVHDFGVLPGVSSPYFVMERLNGHTLWEELRSNGPLDPARASDLFAGVLDALACAHELGVVHKDLKPSNLFLRNAGEPDEMLVVLDFGVATRIGRDDSEGMEFSGTPLYAAPEYIDRREIGPLLDQYQIGLVLAEALTGAPAVQAQGVWACLRAHLDGNLELPGSEPGTELPEVVRRAVAREPHERFESVRAMHDALVAASPSPRVRSRTSTPAELGAPEPTPSRDAGASAGAEPPAVPVPVLPVAEITARSIAERRRLDLRPARRTTRMVVTVACSVFSFLLGVAAAYATLG